MISKPGLVVLNVSGVGYKIYISSKIELKTGETGEFYVYQYIREDRSDLYGFKTFKDLELFEKLISVNGVGPKAAMAIMTISETAKIISAISLEDITFFCSIPGIGKKVAAKIILDLKTKIDLLGEKSIISSYESSVDIIDALVSLGYKKAEIIKVVGTFPLNLKSDQDKIKWALKELSN